MKRSTLLIVLVAVIAGAVVYFLEIKDAKPRDETPDSSRPAFSFKREDITAISIKRPAGNVVLESQDGKWHLKEPVAAPINESAVESLVSDIANARIERSMPVSADQAKSFGLAEPAVTVEIKLKDGKQHTIRLGSKDFSNLSAYAYLDDAKEASLVPASLLTSADKSVNDLRDLTVLGGLSQYDVSNVAIRNSSGAFTLAKSGGNWVLKTPQEVPADETEVSSLLSELTTAKATEVASENASDLAPYGLDKPAVTITTQLSAGGEKQVSVGTTKTGETTSYYAKSSDRAPVFKIDSALFEKLNAKPASLRSKQIIKLDSENLTRIWIKNSNVTMTVEKNSEGKWIIKEPKEQKDKEAILSKFTDAFDSSKATEVIDKPSASVLSKLSKPAVEVRYTTKDGKSTGVKVSAADGEDVYARVDGSATVFKVSKQLIDTLTFKAADVTM
jgi:hypothetical protein